MPEEELGQDEELIQVIDKGPAGRIHVRLSRFRDRDYLDIRNFYEADEGEWKPTRKGIAVPVDLVPQLLAALTEAEPRIAKRAAGRQPAA